MALGGFRYPHQFMESIEPVLNHLRDSGMLDDPSTSGMIEEFIARYMDRDRALEDFVTANIPSSAIYDAVVDSSFTTSNSSSRQFKGIGEAISFLGSIGLTSVQILVKPKTSLTAYQEPADITGTPVRVKLVSAGIPPFFASTTNHVVWDIRGRSMDFTVIQIEGFQIRSSAAFGNASTDLFNSSNLTGMYLKDCLVTSNSTFLNQLVGNGASSGNDVRIILDDTALSNMSFGRAAIVIMYGGTLTWSSSYTFTTQHQNSAAPTSGTGGSYLVGVAIAGSSATVSVTWNNTNCASSVLSACTIADRNHVQFLTSASRLSLTWPASTSPQVDIAGRVANASDSLNITFTSPNNGWECTVKSMMHNNSADTTFTKTGTNFGSLRGEYSRIDVTGGARVDVSLNASLGSASAILRGNGILADIVIQSNTAGTALQGIGLIRSCTRTTFHTFGTMNQAWTLDGTSVGNICDFSGASVATNPGVDSGANNIIRQT